MTFNRVTADEYFAAPDGSLDWVVPDAEIDAAAVENIPAMATRLPVCRFGPQGN